MAKSIAKRIFAAVISFTLTAVCFAGCGKDDNDGKSSAASDSAASAASTESSAEGTDPEPAADELKAPVNDSPIDISQGATENMLIRSVFSEGDTARLAEKVKNAVDNPKETTTIVYLGDSITAGSAAGSSQNAYTKQFTKWWEDNISYYVQGINAGIGATDSYLAVHRAEAEVFSNEPDIIFIEFINDQDNEFYKTTMDSLIRNCLAQPNNPAVVLIEMTMEDGTCPQNVHTEVAEAYGVPVISYHDAILPEVEAGNIAWKDISPDNIHPNDQGHIMLGQMLSNFVGNIKDNIDSYSTEYEPFDIDSESPTGYKYKNPILADKNSDKVTVTDEGGFTSATTPWNFQDGWMAENGGSVTFEIEFQNLGMLYYKTTDGLSGTASVTVDGVEISEINADFTGGWGDYACNNEIVSFEETGKHTVTVSVPEGKKFELLRWMIS